MPPFLGDVGQAFMTYWVEHNRHGYVIIPAGPPTRATKDVSNNWRFVLSTTLFRLSARDDKRQYRHDHCG